MLNISSQSSAELTLKGGVRHESRMQIHANDTSLRAIGVRVIAVLRAIGISQAEASRSTGIAKNTMTQWIKGDFRPSLDEAFKLCDRLGVTLDYLYRGNMAGMPFDLAQRIAELPEEADTDEPAPRRRGRPPRQRIAAGE